MAGKYPWNIIRVGVEVSRGRKVFKMRDVQEYPRAPKTVHFQPHVIKNPNQNFYEQFLNHCRFYFSFIKDRMTNYYSFDILNT